MPQKSNKVPQGRQPQGGQPMPQQEPGAAPIRKKGPSPVIIVVGVLVLAAIAVIALLVVPSCTGAGGGGDNVDGIEVTNVPEDSELTTEQLVDRAKSRFAGVWVINSKTDLGGGGEDITFPTNVTINEDGTCSLSMSDTEYSGSWSVDGSAVVVRAKSEGGEEITKYLSIDDIQMTISSGTSTATYVRTRNDYTGESATE